MKTIKINSILSNFEDETTTVEAIAKYDEVANTIEYTEEELKVKVSILKNKVILNRKNEDYNLTLEFVENEKVKCEYDVRSIGLNVEVDVFTKKLEIKDNMIYIDYELFNENKSIGNFEYKLIFRE